MSADQGGTFEVPPAEALFAMHAELLALYGGSGGIRDPGALDAALARPHQLLAYGDSTASVPQLAAAVAFSICRIRHPFTDGNKRVAFAALVVSLDLNGLLLDVSETNAADIMLAVAGGDMSEDAFAAWVAANTCPKEADDN